MTVSVSDQRIILSDCFGGRTRRDCDNCPAHKSAGGMCCFGDINKHDADDPECADCRFFTSCQSAVINEEAEAQHFSRYYGQPIIEQKRPVAAQPRKSVISPSPGPPPSRFSIRPNWHVEPPREKTTARPAMAFRPVVQQQQRTLQVIPKKTEVIVTEEETMFQRFCKDVVWFGFQGALEGALEFVKTHRLP